VDSTTQANRTAWEAASQKHVREHGDLLAQAAAGSSLTGTERDLLREILGCSPEVVHLQSGHGLDDVALVQAGARPSGHLFVYEAHPAVTLWTWDEDRPRIREDRSYFARSHVNDTFPARGAVEWQWTLGQVVTAVAAAGMEILHLGEYPEPFWRPGGVSAAAWGGHLPNSFTLLARRTRLRHERP
jgi:hypothetical protein